MKSDTKVCSRCSEEKSIGDYYLCQGNIRGECKRCTIVRNVRYQRENKSWMNRFVDENQQRTYMVDYYSRNKEKFAEYRRKFRDRNPDYYRNYGSKRKYEQK